MIGCGRQRDRLRGRRQPDATEYCRKSGAKPFGEMKCVHAFIDAHDVLSRLPPAVTAKRQREAATPSRSRNQPRNTENPSLKRRPAVPSRGRNVRDSPQHFLDDGDAKHGQARQPCRPATYKRTPSMARILDRHECLTAFQRGRMSKRFWPEGKDAS